MTDLGEGESGGAAGPSGESAGRLAGPGLPLVVGLALIAAGLVSWSPMPVGAMHDDGVYSLLGRSLASGDGYRFVGIAGEPPAARFPPVYPAILAGLWWLGDDVAAFGQLATALNLLLTVASGVLFSLLLRDRLGFRSDVALLVTLLAWSNAALWTSTFVPLSEPMFMLLTVLALGVLVDVESGDRGWGRVVLLIGLLALTTLTRTAGIAFAVAAVLALGSRRRYREAAAVGVGVGVALLPWLAWSRRATATLSESYRDYFASYSGWLADRLLSSPAEFIAGLPAAALDWCGVLARTLLPGAGGAASSWLGLALLGVAASGWVELARRSPGVAVSGTLYVAVLLVWPFRSARLVVPLVPFVFIGLALFATMIEAKVAKGGRSRVRWGGAALAGVVLAVSGAHLVGGGASDPLRIRLAQMGGALRAIEEHTPEGAVIGAPELWPAIPLYSDRVGVPSARFQPGAVGPVEGTPREQYGIWAASGLQYLVTEAGGRVHGEAVALLRETCPGQVVVLDRWLDDGQTLLRIDWDEGCRERLESGRS